MAVSITSFAAASGTISLAASTTLTGVFAGGGGFILPGNIPISSGVPFTVTPPVTTTYTLYVTDGQPVPTHATATATVTVTIPATRKLTISGGGGVLVGVNNYFYNGPVWNIIVNPDPFCETDHIAHTNENTILYDVTINNSENLQILGMTDLNTLLAQFGLSWA